MKDKIKNKRVGSRGVTLISLIMTIILLVILAGVTVEVVDKNLIHKAQNVTNDVENKFDSEQGNIDNRVNEWGSIENIISNDNKNHAPTLTVTVQDVTGTTAKIIAVGVDEDGDKLKYALVVNRKKYEQNETGTWELTDLAGKTTYQYSVTVTDGIDDAVFSGTFKTESSNTAPEIALNEVNTRTSSSISINAKATDENNDNLTYKLYTSTEQTGTYSLQQTSNATTQNTAVTLTASNLSQYTTYWWYIEVSDGIETATTEKEKKSAKTKCSGATSTCSTTSCNGNTTSTCTTCSGDGTESYTCTSQNTLCESCQTGVQACSGPFTDNGATSSKCGHGDYYHSYTCDSCGYSMSYAPCYNGSITHWRSKCSCGRKLCYL